MWGRRVVRPPVGLDENYVIVDERSAVAVFFLPVVTAGEGSRRAVVESLLFEGGYCLWDGPLIGDPVVKLPPIGVLR